MGNVRTLVLTVPANQAELAADRLWQLGVRAVEERSAHGEADREVELWTTLGDDPVSVLAAAPPFPPGWSWRVVDVDVEAAGAETWRAHARPQWVTPSLLVIPAWLPDEQSPDVQPPDEVVVVRIEPGAAFGLGDHPTTLLTLRALVAAMGERDVRSVLDVGCGSGVLAVTAALSGAEEVRAIDVSPDAVASTLDNAARNGVAERVSVDDTRCGDLTGTFDVVVANILAPTLVALASDLRRSVAVDGRLVISGVLVEGHDHVLEALVPMEVESVLELDGWAAVTLRPPPGHGPAS